MEYIFVSNLWVTESHFFKTRVVADSISVGFLADVVHIRFTNLACQLTGNTGRTLRLPIPYGTLILPVVARVLFFFVGRPTSVVSNFSLLLLLTATHVVPSASHQLLPIIVKAIERHRLSHSALNASI